MIEFRDVAYRYPDVPVPIFANLSFTINEGEFVLLAGPSGSGKSTLLRAINGLVPHFYGGHWGGQVIVAGRDTRHHEPRDLADLVGFVLQDPEAQMVAEVVEDELVFGLENVGLDRRVMRRRVEEVLDQLELAPLRRRRLTTLSGGERQRVALAAVLALQPRILVLDEPTSQLDPHGAEEVLTAIQKLNVDLGLTVVLSEHRLERVVQYVDRVLFLERKPDARATGVLRIGTPDQVLQAVPFAPPLAAFGRAVGWQPLPLTIKAAREHLSGAGWDRPVSHPATIEERTDQQEGRLNTWRRALLGTPTPRPTAPSPALAVSSLAASLAGRPVLHNVTHSVAHGELVAIMGRNGAGKTSLLRAIMGLLPCEGQITVDGTPLHTLPTEERARLIGYVPQDPRALLFQPTVRAELRWTLEQHHNNDLNAMAAEARVDATLSLLDLTELADRYPRDLSSGEQQRVALGALLVVDPPVLLLDEPTRGMDYRNKEWLIEGLRRLQQAGHAIVLVTHDVEMVAACADRVLLLAEGEIVTEGPTRTLLNDSLLFSSQIGKLFRHRPWLTVPEALDGLRAEGLLVSDE